MSTVTISPPEESGRTRGVWIAVGDYLSALLQTLTEKPARFSKLGPGILLLTLIAAIRMYSTWATWGDLSIDAGHETYVPAVLAEGKMLYRDVWYHYGPAAPYFNSYLFRIFGVHLSVLYFAGAFAALGSGVFLFLSGTELGFSLAGWTAGAVVLVEAFEPGLFSFPLPYSFASVYGCLAVSVLLWVLLRSLKSASVIWILTAGGLASLALLLKLEYGVASYAALALVIILRGFHAKAWREVLADNIAILPGLAICAAVIYWMVSIRGVEFIIHQNIMSWPTSYFMKTYGSAWLANSGFATTWKAFGIAGLQTGFLAGVLYTVRECFDGGKPSTWQILIRFNLVVWLVVYFRIFLEKTNTLEAVEVAFFPRAMALYLAVGAVCVSWYLFRWGWRQELAGLLLTFGFASVLAFRVLLSITPSGYAVYYNGPAALGYLVLAGAIVQRPAVSKFRQGKAAAFLCYACLAVVTVWAALYSMYHPKLVAFRTEFGTMRVQEAVAANYKTGIEFLKEKDARGEAVLILPEDTTMYFLARTHAPTRVYAFNPGVVSPGSMTAELFEEIESKHVKYLLWSNRRFPEYGVPIFGKDFNQELASYLESRYKLVGPLVPSSSEDGELKFMVWERKGDESSQ